MFKRIMLVTAAMLLVFAVLCLCGASAEDIKTITLADGASQTNAEGVVFDGDVVRVMRAGEYLVSGTLTNGQISVECENNAKVKLYLNGVSIHNETGPAILVASGIGRVSISTVGMTENILSNGENLAFASGDNEPNGVIFSRSDLTITGEGSLTVIAGAMDGIVSKDDLRVKGGVVSVTAPRHGIRGKDYVEISTATITVKAGKDGLRTTADEREDRGYISIEDSTVELYCGDDPFSFVTKLALTNSSVTCIPTEDD